ncbi:MAG TPA: PHP domain-containing protein [Candidatus Ornithoclostridium faecavium]|nr:PHP domain-containing protein [Candidatus Ornithoclostridium faecavium]
MKADLHMHSVFSDGTDEVPAIVAKAKAAGLSLMSLTDHDTVKGVGLALKEGEKQGIKVLPGIEISTYAICEVHILGYNIDINNDRLLTRLAEIEDKRHERIKAILTNLKKYNIELDEEKIFDRIGTVGRMHIAKQLLAKGYCQTITEAFDRYLGERGIAYVPSKRITPLEGVKLIKAAGGLAVVAHPLIFCQKGKLDDLIGGLKTYGLDGLEVYYPTHTLDDTAKLYDLAKKNRLIATGGTDYHGLNKKGVEPGDVDYVPDRFALEKFGLIKRERRNDGYGRGRNGR